MCTIVVLNRVHDDFPLIIAANREELTTREATGPKLLEQTPKIVGGQDVAQGGTWMGVTATGFFVGITNQHGSLTLDTSDQSMLSRGQLVMDILRTNDRHDAKRHIQQIDPTRYRSFNLLFGDSKELWVAYGRTQAETISLEQVPHGIHVLPNDRLNADDNRKVTRACHLAKTAAKSTWPNSVPLLQQMLADHDKPEPDELAHASVPGILSKEQYRQMMSLCIHTPGYETRSSTILALEKDQVAHYLFANGAPCQHPFNDATHLLR